MTVKKLNGFRAPYRSLTLRSEVGALAGLRSGVMSLAGQVTQTGSTITVPPVTFLQNGLIVEIDSSTLVAAPTMAAPYYLTARAQSLANIDDIVWQYAKSPLDLGPEDVIIASYDGTEWREPQLVSIGGVYGEIEDSYLSFGKVGPFKGLWTSIDGGNYRNTAGDLVDRQGLRTHLEADVLLPVVAADTDYSRVDKVLYRRPKDSLSRIGVRKLVTGGTFANVPSTLHQLEYLGPSAVRQAVKTLVSSDNSAHILTMEGYGANFELVYTKVSSDRMSVLVAASTIITGITDGQFDAVLDASNNLHVVYTVGQQIRWQKFDSSGASLGSAARVDTQASQCKNPVIATDPANSALFISYQCQSGVSVSQIYFRTLTLFGLPAVAPKSMAGSLTNLVDPSIFVTDDLWVYLSWTDQTTGRVHYRIFNDLGDPLFASVHVSGATAKIGGGTLADVAKKSKIRVADNKEVFVGFLQDKGSSTWGLSFWTGGSAFMQTLISGGESFLDWDFGVEPVFNGLNISLVQASRADYVRMEGNTVLFALPLSVTGAAKVSSTRDRRGSMYHAWSASLSGTFTAYDTDLEIERIGPASVVGGLGTILLTNSQLLMLTTGFSQTPKVGDRIVISTSGSGNNGNYYISAIELVSLSSPNDRYRMTVATAFTATELAVDADFEEPVGNSSWAAKSVSDTKANAYRYSSLDTDVLLARVVMPGSIVLNYVTHTGPSEVQKPYLVGGMNVSIDWSGTTAGSLTIGSGLKLLNLLDNIVYNVAAGSYAMVEGDALYVVLDGANTSVTPQVTPRANLPWGTPIQVLGVVEDGAFNPLLLSEDITQLDPGEGGVLGHDLPTTLRARLGITSETTYEQYTSTYVIALDDTYPEAISKLDDRVEALETNHPDEEEFIGDGTTKIFTLTRFSLNLSNAVFDNEVWVAGRKQRQDPTGGLLRSYRKISINQIEFVEAPNNSAEIIVRKEGTNYGGPIPPIAGQLWSDAVDHDILGPDLAYRAGDSGHRFSEGHFQKTYSERFEMPLPVGAVAAVKVMESGFLNPIGAGKPVSKGSDGKIYPGKSDGSNGQSFIGITAEEFAAFGTGRVILPGPNIPGALTGLGFAPGEDIYLSETEGGYTNNPGAYVGLDDSIIRVGVADCGEGAASASATDLVMMTYVIARP